MKIQITFIPANKDFLPKDKILLRNILRIHSKKAIAVLPFKQAILNFTIYPWQKEGISAFTKTKDWIRLMINPDQLKKPGPKRSEIIDQLIYIAYHETHHACRGYAGYLPNNEHILINSIISEGLADYFAREQHPSEHVLKTTNFDFKEIQPWLKKLTKVKWQKESEDDSWLYGGKDKPRLLGYKIGRYIIQKTLEKNPKLNSIKLVKTTSEDILKMSGVNI